MEWVVIIILSAILLVVALIQIVRGFIGVNDDRWMDTDELFSRIKEEEEPEEIQEERIRSIDI